VVFALSGILGILAFGSHVNESQVFTALLGGLFGLSTIAATAYGKTISKKQRISAEVSAKDAVIGGVLGFAGGLVAGILPGIGSSQSAVLLNRLTRKKGARKYMIALGAINTIAIILSILAIFLIGRARSGIAIAIECLCGSICLKNVVFFMGVGLVSASIAAIATLSISKKVSNAIAPHAYRKINVFVFVSLLITIMCFTGVQGTIIALTGMFLGLYAQAARVKKSLLMNALVVPIVLFFLGLSIVF